VEEFRTQNLAMQNHNWGLSPELWSSTPELNDFYRVLTVSPDRNNKVTWMFLDADFCQVSSWMPLSVGYSYLTTTRLTFCKFVLILQLYISTVEAREYPILGVQWHPEVIT
jgi:gamma-glutamyl hydrolase